LTPHSLGNDERLPDVQESFDAGWFGCQGYQFPFALLFFQLLIGALEFQANEESAASKKSAV